VSAGPEPHVDTQVIEQERRRLSRRLDEVARLCESDCPPAVFYGEMLKRLLESLAAPAGAIWTRTSQGNLQLQFQINMKEVGIDKSDEARQAHEELLRSAVTQPRQIHLLPHSGVGPAEVGKIAAGNPTNFLLLLVPVMLGEEVGGLLEVWQGPNRPLNAVPGFLQFMTLMAELAARYQRNQMIGQMTGQQQLWTQLEAFARQIHSSLNPTEVSYHVANEGRRLVECDRVSVAIRTGRQTRIECVSGTDVVEKRSNLVRLMRKLSDRVIKWGEKLVFTGTKDDSLPPNVLDALDAYLAESGSKLLVVQPLKDEREKDSKQPPRAALVMECFDPPAEPQQLIARLDVVSRHATTALYNSVEYRRIPMRFLWMPLAKVQEGLGGKARAISALVVVLLAALISALVLVPYPLKMESKGELQPQVIRKVFPTHECIIKRFNVIPGSKVSEGFDLAQLWDPELHKELTELDKKLTLTNAELYTLEKQIQQLSQPGQINERHQKQLEKAKRDVEREFLQNDFDRLKRDNHADENRLGEFRLEAPVFSPKERDLLTQYGVRAAQWKVLNSTFREELTERQMKPSEEVMRLGVTEGPWEIVLKIPQKHIGQVLMAYDHLKVEELEVDFLVSSDKTRTFKGILHRDKIGGQADPSRDDNNEAEPVVTARVDIESDKIDPKYRITSDLLLSGTEIHAKVRCGNHAMGYSLFYGVWEFFYEKVVFFF
jgi:hypothetical protein